MKKIFFIYLFLLLTFSFKAFGQPAITKVKPSTAIAGKEVTIYGANFSTISGNNTVTFGGQAATVNSILSTNSLKVTVPSIEAGHTNIQVSNSTGSSNLYDFTVIPDPAPGTFPFHNDLDSSVYANALHAADIDGDGDLDVVTGSSSFSLSSDQINWYENLDSLGTFSSNNVITTSVDNPTSVHAADIDKDGDMDLLSASSRDDKIAWYRNTDGLGSFSSQLPMPTAANGASSVYATDLDGDGDMDVLAAARSDDKVVWYENQDGQGDFSGENVLSNSIASATKVYAADVDGDGDQDVIASSYRGDEIVWFTNDGLGGFGGKQVITSAADGANSVFSADLDSDGDQDLVSASYNDNKIAWYENTDGLGSFSAEKILTTQAYSANAVSVADLNGDGNQDILATTDEDSIGGRVLWLRNKGSGNFSKTLVVDTTAGNYPPIFPADIDSDGDQDILYSSQTQKNIAWYENKWDNSITGFTHSRQIAPAEIDTSNHTVFLEVKSGTDLYNFTPTVSVSPGATLTSSATDHSNEVSYEVKSYTDSVQTWKVKVVLEPSIGDVKPGGAIPGRPLKIYGTFDTTQVYAVNIGGKPVTINNMEPQLLEVNVPSAGVGLKDLWVANKNTGSADTTGFTILDSPSPGDTWVNDTITTAADGTESVYATDIDGDGDLDVLAAAGNNSRIYWYENTTGGGTFGTANEITASATGVSSVFSADLDEDGDQDVLAASSLNDEIAWYENTDGAGTFGSENQISIIAVDASSVYAADLDGDGDMDVLSASEGDDKIAWYENTDGQGSFSSEKSISLTVGGAISVKATDLDGDGDQDIISASNDDDEIIWYENLDGRGDFSNPMEITSSADGVASIHVTDIDGDGDQDVLAASNSYNDRNKITWYENQDGQGSFSGEMKITVDAIGANSVYAADLDGDGDQDVLSASDEYNGTDKIALYENRDGQGDFGKQKIITLTASGAASVFAADLNGDGYQDVLSGSVDDDKVAWYENKWNNDITSFTHPQDISTTIDTSAHTVKMKVVNGTDLSNFNPAVGVSPGATLTDSAVDHTTTVNYTVTSKDGVAQTWSVDVSKAPFQLTHSKPVAAIAGNQIEVYGNFAPSASYSVTIGGTASTVDEVTSNTIKITVPGTTSGLKTLTVTNSSTGNSKSLDFTVIASPSPATYISDSIIDTTATDVEKVVAADIDGDGDNDILSAFPGDSTVAWYENQDGQGNFSGQNAISTIASGVSSLYPVDLDNDGDLDVITNSGERDTVAWYENTDGLGSFSSQKMITATYQDISQVHAGDLDGDGDQDVIMAVSEFSDPKVVWYENDGSGGFGDQNVIGATDIRVYAVYTADFDNDGDQDVVAAASDYSATNLAWFENDGQGEFTNRHAINTDAQGITSLFTADLDGDGHQDLLAASQYDDKVAWFKNDGMGSFSTQNTITTSADGGSSVYANDLDGDGYQDVISASAKDSTIAWYKYQDSTGTFSDPITISILAKKASSVFAADMDSDGDPDVLSSSVDDNKIAWYESTWNNDIISFTHPQELSTVIDTSNHTVDMKLVNGTDLTNFNPSVGVSFGASLTDSAIDHSTPVTYTVTSYDGTSQDWTINVSSVPFKFIKATPAAALSGQEVTLSGIFSTNVNYSVTVGGRGASLVDSTGNTLRIKIPSADSGLQPLIVANDNASTADTVDFTVLKSPAPGKFTNIQEVSTAPDSVQSVYAADLDGDGDQDVISASQKGDSIVWYENTGSGFSTENIIASSADSPFHPLASLSVLTADLDDDGDQDVLASSFLYSNDKMVWYENNGAGNFGSEKVIVSSSIQSLQMDDLDGDGDRDILFVNLETSSLNVTWVENLDGQGNFGDPVSISAGGNFHWSARGADFDGDGDKDVLTSLNKEIGWYQNQGKGEFSSLKSITTAVDSAFSTYPADLDGDGDMDVLSASIGDNKLAWYENTDGAGSFGAQQVISITADSARIVYAADMDSDGDPDVITASPSKDTINWYENDGLGSFSEKKHVADSANNVKSIYPADMNGDGDLDLLAGLSGKVALYPNEWTGNDITAFTHPDATIAAKIDTSAYHIDLEVKNGTDLINFNPSVTLSNGASRTDTITDHSTEVTYTVKSENGVSQDWNVKVTTVPDAPVIQVDTILQTTSTLSWNKPEYATGYELEVSQDTSFTSNITDYNPKVLGDTTQESISGLSKGARYFLRMRASSTYGTLSSNSALDTILTIPAAPVPDTSMTVTTNSVTVKWTGTGIIDEYHVDVSADTFNTFLDGYNSKIVSDTLLKISGLEPATNYSFRVRAENSTGASPNSHTLNILTVPAAPIPDTVATTVTTNSATVKWTGKGDIDNYLVDGSADTFNTFLDGYNSKIVSDTLLQISGLEPATNYSIRIGAENASGVSSHSDTLNILTIPAAPIPEEVSVTASSGTVKWTASGIINEYHVNVSPDNSNTFLDGYDPKIVHDPDTELQISGLASGTKYDFLVSAKNNTGTSSNSDTLNILTLPDAPQANAGKEKTTTSFRATWETVKGAEEYILEVSKNDFNTLVDSIPEISKEYHDITGLDPGTTYKYQVRAKNASGLSDYSNVITIETDSKTGGESASLSLTFTGEFYPSDTETSVTIEPTGVKKGDSLIIQYRGLIEKFYSENKLPAPSGGTHTFNVSSQMLDVMGLDFKVLFLSGSDTITRSGKIYRSFNNDSSPSIPIEKWGGKETTWNLISIPYDVNNKDVDLIFDSYVSANYKHTWRVMKYDNNNNNYDDFTGRTKRGEAYWFNAIDSATIQIGAGTVTTEIPFELILQKGWNLIGNPYNVKLAWDQILVDNGNPGGVGNLQVFEGFEQKTSKVLKPFKGGFVWADQIDTLYIDPKSAVKNARKGKSKNKITDKFNGSGAWQLALKLRNNGETRALGGVGMHPQASELKDRYDEMAVPRFIKYTDLFTRREDYFYPKFARDVVPPAQSYTWDFTLGSNNTNSASELVWERESLAGSQAEWYLLDKSTGNLVNMKQRDTYKVNLTGKEFKFKVYYRTDNVPVFPDQVFLGDARPNPAGKKTVIPVALPEELGGQPVRLSVYNMKGQLMEVLTNGTREAGFHNFEWDFDEENLPSGVYIYRLLFKQSDIDPMQKKIIVK